MRPAREWISRACLLGWALVGCACDDGGGEPDQMGEEDVSYWSIPTVGSPTTTGVLRSPARDAGSTVRDAGLRMDASSERDSGALDASRALDAGARDATIRDADLSLEQFDPNQV
jgi:hypothetical protein